VKLIGLGRENVVCEASRLLEDSAAYKEAIPDHNPYGDGIAAERIVQAILYYFDCGSRPENFVTTKHTD